MNESERQAEIERALAEPFTMEGARIERDSRPVKILYSARIPAEFSEEIAEIAERGKVTPSDVIRTLVEEALHQRHLAASEKVTVDRAEIHRLIDLAMHPAA